MAFASIAMHTSEILDFQRQFLQLLDFTTKVAYLGTWVSGE